MRHGGRAALARRRRFEDFCRFGLHQQADIAPQLAQAARDQTEHAGELHQAIALGVPGLLGQVQLQLRCQRLSHRHGLLAQRCQGAGGTAELQHQQARFQLCQTLATAGYRPQPPGDFQPQGDRRRMLQPGTPSQRHTRITLGLGGKNVAQLRQVRVDQRHRSPQLQYQAGVHHILAGRAQVHIAFGPGIFTGNQLAQRLHQWNRRIARRGNRHAEGIHVIQRGQARLGNRCDGGLGNQPDLGLGPGQPGFKIQHALQAALVAEHLGHAACREVSVEQLIARAQCHSSSLTDRGASTPPVSADAS
ncbi:hypothetical protein ALQ38_05522 [Pseudomonas marginalis pv. marginalis]|nr:hypothetical protein ALQ38_05522 [Pseudomonas marginalis pv. marginalis]